MYLKIIEKSIYPLFFSTLIVGLFYWQFIYIYSYIIENFTNDKLSTLYAHLFIYIFLIHTLFTSVNNLLNYFLIKSKLFIAVSIIVLLIFYALSYSVLYDVIDYFISYPLSDNALMGVVLFIVGTFSYSLYSVGILLFKNSIPLIHVLVFTLLALLYSAGFIDTYCYPISEIFTKFS
ncbi:hypothetical protein KKC13_05680 [bacterium]|nr:hypothetical protein [bacterium]MBU1957339.1 hypothetical protein [bacterium]